MSSALRPHRFKTAFATSPIPAAFAALLFAGEGERGLRAARELGYDAIDLSLRDPTDQAVVACAEAAVSSGLAIRALGTGQSFHTDRLSLVSMDPKVIATLADRMVRLIDFAARFNASVIVGGIRGRLEGDTFQKKDQYSRAIELLGGHARYASRCGVSLLIEPLNRYETNFLNTVSDALGAIREIGADNVGVLADTFHMNIEESSMSDALRLAGQNLGHVQFADSNRCAAGQGHINFHKLAEVLRDIGYSGYVSAEILPIPDSWIAAEQSINYFHQL